MDKVEPQKLVGPVIRSMDQEIIEALLIAIADDNPDAELFYEDHGSLPNHRPGGENLPDT
jgi:hypothetical protein